MQLRALKLFGFKTFAEATNLDFHEGITAVVGPNGSGKSNLVDAIRWVLGEQSSRSLRSQRMDDVIFAGNQKRKPLGMAEVSITFDNTDGRLPSEYREVQITRRAYRAGEIEYFINRNHCRLRDVHELLMGTGLGPGSYAIVSQGQIDSILSSKPTERRALFEETAGINRFLARKNEALRNLEKTEQNGIRVSDLIAELERRIPELDTQVRRAKRFRKVSARVRDLELLSYLRASESRRGERERVRAALDAIEARQTGAAARAAALGGELSALRTQIYRDELRLEEQRAQAQATRDELARLEADDAAARARLDALEHQSSATGADVERVAAEREQLENTLRSLDERIAPLQTAAEAIREDETRVANALAEARAGLDAIYSELRAFEAVAAQQAADAAERRAQLQSALAQIERLESDLTRIRETHARAIAGAEARRAQFAEGEAAIEELEARHERERANHESLDAQLKELTAGATAREERLRELAREHASAEARLHTIEELEAQLEGHVPGTRAVIEAWQRGELRGLRGVVSNLLKVDERYARALDIAFGAGLSNIIAETSEDAERAVNYLTQREAGRATFLPLDTLAQRRGHELGALAGRPGVIGYAHTLVETDPQYHGIVAFLVGRILIVESLPVGIQLVRREGFRDTIVTLSGEQILGGGAITGGKYRRERSILARRAQAETLRAELPVLRTQIETLEQQRRETDTQARELAQARENARRANGETQLALQETRTKLESLASELERLDGEIESSSARAQELEAEHREADAHRLALERVADAAVDQSGERERLEARLAEARERIAAAEAEQRDVATQASSRREALAGAIAERDASRARLGMLDTDRERAAAARETMVREIGALREQHAARAENLVGLRARVAEADTLVETLRRERDASTAKANGLDSDARLAANEEREAAIDGEASRTRLAEIDAELGMLAQQFAQNPADEAELADVVARYAEEPDDVLEELPRLREELARLANVNLNAEQEREELAERERFLREQLDDLGKAREKLLETIAEIEKSTQVQFNETFERVSTAFSNVFSRLFPGGEAKMWQTNPENLSESGVEISVQPPGKKMMSLTALSGGERAMTAAALIFALIKVKPSPFYLLDEVDAALDDANVERFSSMVKELAGEAQLLIVTHNKRTMEMASRMYGVTMAEPGVSSIISAELTPREEAEAPQELVAVG